MARRVSLSVMVLFYVASGVMHFLQPAFYLAMMPPYLPWPAELVSLSGVIEIALGVLLLVPGARRLAAWGIILLLVAVFPANVHMAIEDVGGYGLLSWLRLPLQAFFIGWAHTFTRHGEQGASLSTRRRWEAAQEGEGTPPL